MVRTGAVPQDLEHLEKQFTSRLSKTYGRHEPHVATKPRTEFLILFHFNSLHLNSHMWLEATIGQHSPKKSPMSL